MSEVYDATVFLLPSIATTAVPTQPASAVVVKTQQPAIQQPGAGTVVKMEYSQTQFSGCYFCRGNHITRNCATCDKYARDGKIMITDTNKISMPNGRGIPGRQEEGNFKQCIDNFLCNGPTTGTNTTILGNMYCHTEPTTQVALDIEPCTFMHTCTDTLEDNSDDEELTRLEMEANQAWEAFVAVKAGRTNHKDKGKNMQFEGVSVPARTKPGPMSRVAEVVEEVTSPQVKAAGSKPNNMPNKGTVVITPAGSSSMHDTISSSPSSRSATIPDDPPANQSSTQYSYAFPLEDKDTDKHIVDCMLDSTISMPMYELIAVSTDMSKGFKDLTTTKCITVRTVSINKLSSTPKTQDFLKKYDGCLQRSDDGCIVAEHFTSLRCIRAVTHHGQILSCILDQGTECIVMLHSVWRMSGGILLRSDHKLTMESVNTSTNETLGVIENLPLDFGAGEMLFQVQVVPTTNFNILLGQPFFMLTSCHMEDLPNGEQDITLTDPNTGKVICIPTNRWAKKCAGCEAGMHPPNMRKKGF
jgi:hypothetical protein